MRIERDFERRARLRRWRARRPGSRFFRWYVGLLVALAVLGYVVEWWQRAP